MLHRSQAAGNSPTSTKRAVFPSTHIPHQPKLTLTLHTQPSTIKANTLQPQVQLTVVSNSRPGWMIAMALACS